MKTQAKFITTIAPLAAALLFSIGTAQAAGPTALEEGAPATLAFGTDNDDPNAAQVPATAGFINGDTQEVVEKQVIAGFDERGHDADGAAPMLMAYADRDEVKAGTR
jgi:hypothetical protein